MVQPLHWVSFPSFSFKHSMSFVQAPPWHILLIIHPPAASTFLEASHVLTYSVTSNGEEQMEPLLRAENSLQYPFGDPLFFSHTGP